MAKIALFYGSNQGNTEAVGYEIANLINEMAPDTVEVHNIGNTEPSDLLKWDRMIMGISTWDFGQLQDDWALFIPRMENLDLKGKKVALFGLGDQFGYSNNYIDSVGILGEAILYCGGEVVGHWPTEGYQFESSLADRGANFLGLALDQESESAKTTERVKKWIEIIRPDLGF